MSSQNTTTRGVTMNTTKKLVFSALAVALALVTSYLKVFEMPMGGSITLLSMLFIVLIGYWFGPRYGLIAAVAYGFLQLVIDPYVVTIPQLFLDYPLAFGALGLSGFFRNRKFGLQIGYIVGVFGRFVFSTLSGVIFFAQYAPDGWNPWVYSAAYQGAYLGAEAAITLVIISIPPVTKALNHVKQLATAE